MIDRRLQRLYNKFTSDPEDVKSIADFIVLSKRLELEVPNKFEEIQDFTKNSISLMESYIEAILLLGEGGGLYFAYRMVENGLSSKNWAEDVIEKNKVGEQAWLAYMMVSKFNSPKEWAEKVIKKAITGNPSNAAYAMLRNHKSSKKWVESVIENAETGNPVWDAKHMLGYHGSSKEWYDRVFDNAKKLGLPTNF